VMKQGELVEIGATEQITSAPRHEYTRTLLAATPELEPAVT
jgi:peptide/nickel transport system ATP-binding protein